MILKVFGSLVFLLLTLKCLDAEILPRVDCGTATKAACFDQFKAEFSKFLHRSFVWVTEKMSELQIETIKEAIKPTTPQAENAIRYLNDLGQQAKATNITHDDLTNLFHKINKFNRKYPDIYQIVVDYWNVNPDAPLKYSEKEEAHAKTFFEGIVNNTLELFAGLRPQDYEEFIKLQSFREEFEIIKQDIRDRKDLIMRFSAYLGVQY